MHPIISVIILIFTLLVIVSTVNILKNIYQVFINPDKFQGNYKSMSINIIFYESACAIYFPFPSEVPLLLYRKFSLFWIIIVSSIGKGLGAYIVYIGWYLIENILNSFHLTLFFWQETNMGQWIMNFIQSEGFWAYLFMQSIPFAPMRSSIYSYSLVSENGMAVVLGAVIGTIFRNLLMFFFIGLGYKSVTKIFKKRVI